MPYQGSSDHRSHVFTLALTVSLACFVLPAVAPGQQPGGKAELIEVAPGKPIPEGYQTYSLFLICSPEWLLAEKHGDLVRLYRRFRAFGRAIGPNNLAVWFSEEPAGRTTSAEELDTDRSLYYCKQYGLMPSRGPHIVVTSSHPTLGKSAENLTMSLGQMNAQEITTAVNSLADQVVYWKVPERSPESGAYWQAWQQAFEKTRELVLSVAQQVTLTIDSKFLKVEIEPGRSTRN